MLLHLELSAFLIVDDTVFDDLHGPVGLFLAIRVLIRAVGGSIVACSLDLGRRDHHLVYVGLKEFLRVLTL